MSASPFDAVAPEAAGNAAASGRPTGHGIHGSRGRPVASASADSVDSAAQGRRSSKPSFRGDASGVSEVIGFMLTFSIISLILVLGMLAFRDAEADAKDRAVELHAQGVADRVASMVVEGALFAENQGTSASFSYRLDLPTDLEGRGYRVRLDDVLRQVVVDPGAGASTAAELFQAGGAGGANLCAGGSEVRGGPLLVRVGDHDNDGAGGTAYCIFLEASP